MKVFKGQKTFLNTACLNMRYVCFNNKCLNSLALNPGRPGSYRDKPCQWLVKKNTLTNRRRGCQKSDREFARFAPLLFLRNNNCF